MPLVPLQADVQREGTAVLPGRLTLDVARALPSDSVTVELRAAQQDVDRLIGAGYLMPQVRAGFAAPPLRG